jgi:hypothetical protein
MDNQEKLELNKPIKAFNTGKYDDLVQEDIILKSKKELFDILKSYKINHTLPILEEERL